MIKVTYMKKMLWTIIVLLTPSFFLLLWRVFENPNVKRFKYAIFIYLLSIIFSVLVFRKKPCSKIALPAGFFISPLFDYIWMSILEKLLERKYHFLFSEDDKVVGMMLIGFIYALPFACITLMIIALNEANGYETIKPKKSR